MSAALPLLKWMFLAWLWLMAVSVATAFLQLGSLPPLIVGIPFAVGMIIKGVMEMDTPGSESHV